MEAVSLKEVHSSGPHPHTNPHDYHSRKSPDFTSDHLLSRSDLANFQLQNFEQINLRILNFYFLTSKTENIA